MAVKTRDTVDIVRDLVSQLESTFVIDSVEDNTTSYRLNTLDTLWLRPKKVITIDGKEYRIISFTINEHITIEDVTTGAGAPTVSAFTVPAPAFFHGVPVMAANQQAQLKSANAKTPFVWLREVLQETQITDPRAKWGRESTPTLLFMDEARYADWTSEEHKTNAIEPLRQMVELFFSKIAAKRGLYQQVLEYNSTARANWGTYLTDKGHNKRFFNQDLSGIEISFDLVMSKKACDTRTASRVCTIGVTVSTTPESFAGANDGTATANVTGDQGNLTYLWTTSDGSIPSGEEVKQTATGLSAGTYNVLVTDNITAGCTAQDSGEVIVTPENELQFDGVNDKVLLTTQINVGVSEDYTLSFQVKFAATSSGSMVIISGLALNRYVGFNLDTNIFYVRNETQQRNFSFPSITTGIRYNCVVSRISDTMRVYMQGVESTTGGISDGEATNYTGISQYINNEVDGNLSNLGIETGTGATPANVASLNANPQNFVSIMGGADLFYRFNESGATVTAPDTSGNSNTGTLTNFIFTPSPWVLKV